MRAFLSVCALLLFVSACAAEEEGGYDLEGFRELTAADLVHKSFRFGPEAGIFELDDPRFGQSSTLLVGEVYGTAAGFALTTEDGSVQGGTISLGSCLFQTTFIGLAQEEPEIGLLSDDFFYCGVDDEGRLGLLDEDEELLIVSEVPTEANPDFDLSVSLSTEAVVEPRFDPATRPETGSATLQLFGNVLSFTLSIENLSVGDELRDGRIHRGGASENGEIVLTLFGSPIQPVRQMSPPFIEGTSITASIFVTPDEVMALSAPGAANYLLITSDQATGGLLRAQLGSATVGPDGGVFTFPNGVVLDIPEGALSETLDVVVTGVPMEALGEALSKSRIDAYAKRRIVGAFRMEPVVPFTKEVKVTLPVDPPKRGELWHQVDIEREAGEIWKVPTDLRYIAERGVVEMKLQPQNAEKSLTARKQGSGGTEHGAEGQQWVIEDHDQWLALKRRCKTQPQPEACERLDPLQPACCELERIPETCSCCKLKDAHYQSSATDASQNRGSETCEILTDATIVDYYACTTPDGHEVGPQSYITGATSPYCPEDLQLEVDISAPSDELFVCKTQEYSARIRGVLPDGTEVIPWRDFDPIWESAYPETAEFIQNPVTLEYDGTLEGLKAGPGLVWAVTGLPDQPHGISSYLEVRSHLSEFTLQPAALPLAVDESELISVARLTRYDHTPLDTSTVGWQSKAPGIASRTPDVGPATRVEGESRGCTEIEAKYVYQACEEVIRMAPVCVDCPIALVTVSAATNTIPVRSSTELSVEASSDGVMLDVSAARWVSSDRGVVDFAPDVGPSVSAWGVSPGRATLTAIYEDDCQIQRASTLIHVCPEIALLPSSTAVEVDDTVQIDLVALDQVGDPMAADFTGATFELSTDEYAEIASVFNYKHVFVKGLAPGTVTLKASYESECATQTAYATIIVQDNSVSGTWTVNVVGGEQTCDIDGDTFFDNIESGEGGELVDLEQTGLALTARYQAFPSATPYTGTISPTGDPLRPYRVQLSVDSSNTIDCIMFLQTNGEELHYGQPICPEDTPEQQWTCQAISCSEYEGINGFFLAGNAGFVGESSWQFNGRGNAVLVEPPNAPVVFTDVPISCTGEAQLIACREGGSPQLERFLGECTSPVDAAQVCFERVGKEPAGAECLPGLGDDDMIACLYCE